MRDRSGAAQLLADRHIYIKSSTKSKVSLIFTEPPAGIRPPNPGLRGSTSSGGATPPLCSEGRSQGFVERGEFDCVMYEVQSSSKKADFVTGSGEHGTLNGDSISSRL
ncbi:hypothetical protein PM082_004938 [Marasmius tenuissimus]|nr:hypothetical protein PM082_004938 [Marasmius tenuissimus]